ncbi:Di-copper centre-containing protein [Armillaria gallica]|uniref:Di-copper centre-containing protein n=1 Tax=Armillaria gallica TaxID=47427 RepID=A0A2H3DK47_ARMGA|nr:Di-copper centre-containing protein [Armillaria gallica]
MPCNVTTQQQKYLIHHNVRRFAAQLLQIRIETLVFFSVLLTLTVSASDRPSHCEHPAIRKEWRTLSPRERTEWIAAVNCLATLPHDESLTPVVKPSDIVGVNASGSYYDGNGICLPRFMPVAYFQTDIVYIHMDMNHKIHFTGLFLPWHRWYVQMYENAFKDKCGYKGTSPYWNWASDSNNVKMSTIFDSKSGLGGWGLPSQDVHVHDGGFGVYTAFRLSYPSHHPLRRNFTIQPFIGLPLQFFPDQELLANSSFTPEVVHDLVYGYVGDFKGFQTSFEAFTGAHGNVHLILGGDLGGICPSDSTVCQPGPTFSVNGRAIFWLHHAMVDKVWYDWQNANELKQRAFEGGSYPNGGPPNLHMDLVTTGEGMFDDFIIRDVISTTDGILCYSYE